MKKKEKKKKKKKKEKKKKRHSPSTLHPPLGHQYSGMRLCLVWKCKSPFVAIIYGLRRLSRVFSALVHYYTITVHGLLTPLSALTGFLKGYATSLPYQCGWGPANVLISHLVPFHSKRRRIAQLQRGKTSTKGWEVRSHGGIIRFTQKHLK